MKLCKHCYEPKEELTGRRSACDACKKARKSDNRKKTYEGNREEILAQQKKYRDDNPEKFASRRKRYREANREKIAAQRKRYREANPEKYAAQQKKYYQATRTSALSMYLFSSNINIKEV